MFSIQIRCIFISKKYLKKLYFKPFYKEVKRIFQRLKLIGFQVRVIEPTKVYSCLSCLINSFMSLNFASGEDSVVSFNWSQTSQWLLQKEERGGDSSKGWNNPLIGKENTENIAQHLDKNEQIIALNPPFFLEPQWHTLFQHLWIYPCTPSWSLLNNLQAMITSAYKTENNGKI